MPRYRSAISSIFPRPERLNPHWGADDVRIRKHCEPAWMDAGRRAKWAKPWISWLADISAGTGATGETHLPRDNLDAIPRNIIVSPAGELTVFDRQWKAPAALPVPVRRLSWARGNISECYFRRTSRRTRHALHRTPRYSPQSDSLDRPRHSAEGWTGPHR